MKPDELFTESDNLFFLQRAINVVSDLELSFKNRTQLASLCATIMSREKNSTTPVSISTLTRNPIYRALLDKQLSKNGTGYELEVLRLKLEVTNLREANKRKDLYLASLPPTIDVISASPNTKPSHGNSLEYNYLIKIIDLLMDYFSEHITIDTDTGEFVHPYLTSSDRIVVPKKIAKYYIQAKLESASPKL